MDYCKKCGMKLKEGVRVCPRCKSDQKELQRKIEEYELEQALKKKKKRKRIAVIAAACACAVLIAAGIVLFIITRPGPIDLTDYLVVEVTGEDGDAVAEYSFDTDSFYEDYGDRVGFVDETEFEDILSLFGDDIDANEYACDYLFSTYVSGTLSPDSGLSVGDYVSFVWEVDEDGIEEVFGVEVTYEDQIFTVDEITDEEDSDEEEDADSSEEEETDDDSSSEEETDE